MKKICFLILLTLIGSTTLFAQEVIRQQSCNNPDIQRQADSLKVLFEKDGFSLLREASMKMESEYEMPVIMPLQQGGLYHFVFIGDISSRLYEVRMYDYSEKQVVYQKKMWGDVDGNIISFGYVPQFSELHMVKPVQVNKKKKKEVCGYVMMFQKTKK